MTIKTYAGIGSRNITEKEATIIDQIASKLRELGYVCLSGNANGADCAFQLGSMKDQKCYCVVMLPWKSFNQELFDVEWALDYYVLGDHKDGQNAVNVFHPAPNVLNRVSRKFHARNYYQVMGFDKYPKVDFVICCADRDSVGNIKGGTSQACRIAKSMNIPIINIRDKEWETDFKQLLLNIEMTE